MAGHLGTWHILDIDINMAPTGAGRQASEIPCGEAVAFLPGTARAPGRFWRLESGSLNRVTERADWRRRGCRLKSRLGISRACGQDSRGLGTSRITNRDKGLTKASHGRKRWCAATCPCTCGYNLLALVGLLRRGKGKSSACVYDAWDRQPSSRRLVGRSRPGRGRSGEHWRMTDGSPWEPEELSGAGCGQVDAREAVG
jgi:hypothetical protein